MRIKRPAVLVFVGLAAAVMASGALAQNDSVAAKRLIAQANADIKARDYDAAVAAFTQAEAADPGSAASFDLCVVNYNLGRVEASLAACNRAIAVDPAKADAWFIKGSELVAQGTMANGKLTAPPGAIEALHRYLELAPDGPHATDVKQMLDFLK
jgi:tetratricopeptide (TPR) repeat protein